MFRKQITSFVKLLLNHKPACKYICFTNKQLKLPKRTLHNVLSSEQPVKNVYLLDETPEPTGASRQNKSCKFTYRTYNCGELRVKNVGEQVTLCGWLEFQRMNKFVVLRDGYGHTQLLIDDQNIQKIVSTLSFESIIKVEGTVLSRPKEMINNKQATGEIEVMVQSLEVLNRARKDLPFNIREFQKAKEFLQMQYRYLALRFSRMQRNLRVRSQMIMAMRNFLVNESDFVDVETPTLFRATPGGAQEFIVPTRYPNQFYSLVQSPQQFKQMLMAGAIDRYFQVARCYRDESARSDRQPEFTQLDIEMSFTNTDGVLKLVEDMLHYSWPDLLPSLPRIFPKMKYNDALEKYGTDKPDTRYEFQLQDCTDAFKGDGDDFSENFGAYCLVFQEPFVTLPKQLKEKLSNAAKTRPEVKFVQSKIDDIENWSAKITQLLSEPVVGKLRNLLNLQNNSLIFLAYGNKNDVLFLLGNVRLEYAKHLEAKGHKIKKVGMHPVWIVDFPLFEKGIDSDSLSSVHHPFTSPHPDDLDLLNSSPLKVRAQSYDLVINGIEIGGGSIRIHDPLLQEKVFQMLGIDKSSMQYMLDMLSSGCPPHGGIALGIDRLLATLLDLTSIRDVIAFPKTFDGRDPLSGAPSPISEQDKLLYHIKVVT